MYEAKRMIYLDDVVQKLEEEIKANYPVKSSVEGFDEFIERVVPELLRDVIKYLENQPVVYAVPLEQYCELRENFIDFVCSGVTNPAPYCKNKFAGCVNKRGWCADDKYCRGFTPDGGKGNDRT